MKTASKNIFFSLMISIFININCQAINTSIIAGLSEAVEAKSPDKNLLILESHYPYSIFKTGEISYIRKTIHLGKGDILYELCIINTDNSFVYRGCELWMIDYLTDSLDGIKDLDDPAYSTENYLKIKKDDIHKALKARGDYVLIEKFDFIALNNDPQNKVIVQPIAEINYLMKEYHYSVEVYKSKVKYTGSMSLKDHILLWHEGIGYFEWKDFIYLAILEKHKGFEDDDYLALRFLTLKLKK